MANDYSTSHGHYCNNCQQYWFCLICDRAYDFNHADRSAAYPCPACKPDDAVNRGLKWWAYKDDPFDYWVKEIRKGAGIV